MRKTVLWQSPHVRVSLSALLALAAIIIIVGCGGGGGGTGTTGGATTGGTTNGSNPPPGQNPLLPFLSGRVVDSSNKGVVGARVTLSGPGLPDLPVTVTSSDGNFVIANVDPKYNAFTVTSPDVSKYYNYALYQAKTYDTLSCKLPLGALSAGTNSLQGNVVLVSAGNNPPPPPNVAGCP